MKGRICDCCGKIIPVRLTEYKLSRQNAILKSSDIDLCTSCYREILDFIKERRNDSQRVSDQQQTEEV